MAYSNRKFNWDFDALKRFRDNYVTNWLTSEVNWSAAKKKQARANLGLGNGDIDEEPTPDSDNIAKSGGIANMYGSYVDNPEFIKVEVDNKNKVLSGIKKDGSHYAYNMQSETIDAKVNKEEGKSLIDAEYASTKSSIENPEYLEVTTDSEDKVLEGIQADGTKVIGGDLNVGGSANINGGIKILGSMEVSGVSYKVIESPEYIAAWIDAEYKVIFGLKADGKTYIGDADFLNEIKNNQEAISEIRSILASISSTIELLDIDALTSITATENPEYISVVTDSEGKVLAGRTPDGTAFENVSFETPKVSIDGHTIENIEDPEGRTEIVTDAESKIISYRDADGVKHENIGIEADSATVNHLNLTDNGMTEFQQALKDSGFNSGAGNWSDATELHIAEPYCARVNFTGINDIPQAKFLDIHGIMEFWDMNGNYFKKEVIMNAQGSSSMGHPKKNIAIDICNNNGWDDDDTFSLQIGDWVPQDSFHLKAFYNDPFRCLCPVAYQLNDEILKTRGELGDYIWKKALLDFDSITSTSNGSSTAKDTEAQYNDGARCFPDGFPCIVYLNGEFYGIYSWQLKKHRDNYHMDKKNTKHIHLDGAIGDAYLFDGYIRWTEFEVRNPKDLIDMNGNKYDGDNPTELIDSTSPAYDGSNSKHVNTAKVKQYIKNMITMKTTIADAYTTYEASEKTAQDIADLKAIYETYFDVKNIIDYVIFSDVNNNYDGFFKNWQWLTYDGVKWYIGVYDCDGVFGNYFQLNDTIVPPLSNHITIEHQEVMWFDSTWIFTPLYAVYTNELEHRYYELRKEKIIDTNNIVNMVNDWLDRIGNKETFKKEWAKWPSFIKNDSIHRMYKWVVESINNMDIVYHYNQN